MSTFRQTRPTLRYKDLERLSGDRAWDALHRLGLSVGRRVIGAEAILDVDSTVETVYGELEGTRPFSRANRWRCAVKETSRITVPIQAKIRGERAAPLIPF